MFRGAARSVGKKFLQSLAKPQIIVGCSVAGLGLITTSSCDSYAPPRAVVKVNVKTNQHIEKESLIRQKNNSWLKKLEDALTQAKDFVRYVSRILTYFLYGAPAVAMAPLAYYYGDAYPQLEVFAWDYLIWAIQKLGPTFVKLAQWASTRPDLYPPRLIEKLQKLQDDVDVKYPFENVENTMREAYGANWKDKFSVDPIPLGTGCVAQVYQGVLTENGKKTPIAIKLIHPHVESLVKVDMEMLSIFSRWLDTFPQLEMLSLGDTFTEFGDIMKSQLDLRIEARNLETFAKKFENEKWAVFPAPINKYVRDNILIETLMKGTPMTKFMAMDDSHSKLKIRLSDLGARLVIKMMFFDNFYHGDLHPGNIFVDFHEGKPRLVVLDCGIVFKSKSDKEHSRLIDICIAFMKHDGRTAARLMVDHSKAAKKTDKIDEFSEAVQQIVYDAEQQSYFEHISEYMTRLCDLARIYQVKLEPGYFNIAMTLKVAEGMALALNRDMDLITFCLPIVLKAKSLSAIGIKKFPAPEGY